MPPAESGPLLRCRLLGRVLVFELDAAGRLGKPDLMLRYRPFLDGPWRLAMGIKALDLAEWIEIDERFSAQLALRKQLLDEQQSAVLAALPESRPGQRELLELLLEHLPRRFPEHYRRQGGQIENLITRERFALAAWDEAPLELAGRLVQEDLCLMQRGEAGYRLVAAVLCFPAHWRLSDKLGRPLQAIHGPVPGFGERLAGPVDRFFASIQVARPVWRVNWSLVDQPTLFLPPEHRGHPKPVSAERAGEQLWLRVERQTLRRLPRSSDVAFGIRTHVEPLADAIDSPHAARALAARIREMPEPMARYKSILPIRAPLLAWLDRRAADQGPSAGR
jgi:dimethylamine monooxygenase subunit A